FVLPVALLRIGVSPAGTRLPCVCVPARDGAGAVPRRRVRGRHGGVSRVSVKAGLSLAGGGGRSRFVSPNPRGVGDVTKGRASKPSPFPCLVPLQVWLCGQVLLYGRVSLAY